MGRENTYVHFPPTDLTIAAAAPALRHDRFFAAVCRATLTRRSWGQREACFQAGTFRSIEMAAAPANAPSVAAPAKAQSAAPSITCIYCFQDKPRQGSSFMFKVLGSWLISGIASSRFSRHAGSTRQTLKHAGYSGYGMPCLQVQGEEKFRCNECGRVESRIQRLKPSRCCQLQGVILKGLFFYLIRLFFSPAGFQNSARFLPAGLLRATCGAPKIMPVFYLRAACKKTPSVYKSTCKL